MAFKSDKQRKFLEANKNNPLSAPKAPAIPSMTPPKAPSVPKIPSIPSSFANTELTAKSSMFPKLKNMFKRMK